MSELREIQLKLLGEWLEIVLQGKNGRFDKQTTDLMAMKKIDKAISALKSEFMKAVGSDKEEKGYLATDVRWHYDNGYNQRGESIRQKIKEM